MTGQRKKSSCPGAGTAGQCYSRATRCAAGATVSDTNQGSPAGFPEMPCPAGHGGKAQKKSPASVETGDRYLKPGDVLLSHEENPILSSALNVFTSEFGMGSGGSRSLWPPGKLFGKRGQSQFLSARSTGDQRKIDSDPMFPNSGSCVKALRSVASQPHVAKYLGVIWPSHTVN